MKGKAHAAAAAAAVADISKKRQKRRQDKTVHLFSPLVCQANAAEKTRAGAAVVIVVFAVDIRIRGEGI